MEWMNVLHDPTFFLSLLAKKATRHLEVRLLERFLECPSTCRVDR